MDINIIVVSLVAILVAIATFFVSNFLHNRKVREFDNIKEAIRKSKKMLLESKKEAEELHYKLEKQTSIVTEKLVDMNAMIKEKRSGVNQKVALLEEKESNLESRLSELTRLENNLNNKKVELRKVEDRTRNLVDLEGRASAIQSELKEGSIKYSELSSEIESLEDTIQDLKSELDLYSRIQDFVGYGVFDTPEYLYETPERYQVEIKKVREQQKSLIKDNVAVELATNIEVNGSSKTALAVLSGQAKLMIRSFNIECDNLLGKLNPSNFDRTLERIEKIAEGLEKTTISLASGITIQYMDLKFDECRLLYEYKIKKAEQDEEQRLIREQIREEQRAIKEYERAVAEAEKEERLYKSLLDKAKQQLRSAHEGEKGDLETRILLLEEQLKEAEQKEARAKSMAEQTRRGHVYIISNIGSFGDQIYKIGLTRRLDPMDRVKELGDASVPFLFDVHAIIYSDDAPAMESALHKKFNHRRVNAVNRRKEFFRVPLSDIKEAVDEMSGIDIDFIMTATAEQYYETRRLQGADA
jgi:hypothetical protein